jgi:hypothetical protein
MIPTFPNFKKLELTDKEDVEKFTAQFPPYSDFNFVSMWIWNVFGDMEISQLNKNLVVIFNDYISSKPLVSFIGKNKIYETTSELINFSQKNYKTSTLKLIPEEAAKGLIKLGFTAISDRDSHDYVYSTSHLASMDAWPKSTISKGIRRFIKKYPDYVIKENLIQEISKDEYLRMFGRWSDNKSIMNHFELNEYKAFERTFEINDKNIKIISLYIENVLVGFTIYEILSDGYAMSHFAKADISYHPSVYDVLDLEEAKILKNKGIKYYNWEQDLGILGIRKAKMKYKPSFLLKQFIVSNPTVVN